VLKNAQVLCSELQSLGYKIATGGTDVHLVLVDVRTAGLTGARAEFILEEISIACNKNTVPGDKSALNPSGIRLGTPALTTRGFNEDNMKDVVQFIHRGMYLFFKCYYYQRLYSVQGLERSELGVSHGCPGRLWDRFL